MALSRRDFIKVSAKAAGAGVLASVGVSLYEPHETVVNQIPVTLERLPAAFDGFRIAQLSDIHFNSYMSPEHLERVVEIVNAQKPDLMMLTGDFVTAHGHARPSDIEAAGVCAAILRKINAPQGSFAVLGNHDSDTGPDAITEVLTAAAIPVLRNQSRAIEREGARFHLVGVDNVTAGHARPEKAARGVPRNECCIAAVHEPDLADEMRKYSVDFQMSGHSHGGQIRFPGVGAVVLPPWGRKYSRGAYRVGALQLYTNSGIGVLGLPMRFLCPPELSVFELKTPSAIRG